MSKRNPRAATAYGQRMQGKGERSRVVGNLTQGVGALGVGVGAASGQGGMLGLGFGLMGAGGIIKGKGLQQVAKGRAIDSRVAQARGGSAALGLRGIVPAPNGMMSSFDRANQTYNPAHAAGQQPTGNGVQEGGRGWANPKVQEAAQAARRAKKGQ